MYGKSIYRMVRVNAVRCDLSKLFNLKRFSPQKTNWRVGKKAKIMIIRQQIFVSSSLLRTLLSLERQK